MHITQSLLLCRDVFSFAEHLLAFTTNFRLHREFLSSMLSAYSSVISISRSAWLCRQSHEIEICQSSMSQLSQNLLVRFHFSCCLPWAIPLDFFFFFWIFENKLQISILTIFFFFFVNMGTSNHFWVFSNFFWIFFYVHHKSTVLDFWNFEFTIFEDFFFRKFQIHHCIL